MSKDHRIIFDIVRGLLYKVYRQAVLDEDRAVVVEVEAVSMLLDDFEVFCDGK